MWERRGLLAASDVNTFPRQPSQPNPAQWSINCIGLNIQFECRGVSTPGEAQATRQTQYALGLYACYSVLLPSSALPSCRSPVLRQRDNAGKGDVDMRCACCARATRVPLSCTQSPPGACPGVPSARGRAGSGGRVMRHSAARGRP